MQTVELRQAFEWTCEECGLSNFESTTVAELTPEERKDLLTRFELGEADEEHQPFVEFLSSPDTVTCSHCKTEFHAECNMGQSMSNEDLDELLGR